MDAENIRNWFREALEAAARECPCLGTGWVSGEWVFGREPVCTCGAGDPRDISILHKWECDAVPCPFCPLEKGSGDDDEQRGDDGR